MDIRSSSQPGIAVPPPNVALNVSAWGNGRGSVFIGFLLLLAIGLVFGQSLGHPFVNYDDPDYISANAHVTGGLTPEAIYWAFTERHSNNWHPLTSISHMIDCGMFGVWAGGHHLINVLLHAATSVTLFFFLRKATGYLWPSALTAALFAIHPLHVESVAWASERKDVLSGLCFMLTLVAYWSYARRPFSVAGYLVVSVFFALGLMAKPMLVTLPLVLLLLDCWPLGRFRGAVSSNAGSAKKRLPRKVRFSWLPVLEKVPLAVIAGVISLETLWVQRDFAMPLDVLPLGYRLEHAAVSYMAYLKQMVWPFGLTVFYPYPEKGDVPAVAMIAGSILAGISLLAVLSRREHPYFIVGWLWYLIMLLPVIGLVQVGLQSQADRFTYLPSVGPLLAIVWGGWKWSMRCCWRWQCGIAAGLVLAVLMVAANIQVSYWRSSEALWKHALECTTRNACAFANLADALRDENCFSQAAENYDKSLKINPKYPEGYDNLVLSLGRSGKLDESIAGYCHALRTDQCNWLFCRNLGLALVRANEVDKAIELWLEELNRPTPDELAILNDIAWLRATHPNRAFRNGPEAVKIARQAEEKTRGLVPEVLDALAAAHAEDGQFIAAQEACQRAIALAAAQHRTGLAAAIQKRLDAYRDGFPFREWPQDFPRRWQVQLP